MAISSKLLNEGERVVVSTRTHAKALLGPVLLLLLTAFLVAFVGSQVNDWFQDDTARTVAGALLGAVAAAVVLWWVLRPFVRWFTTTYTFTNRRLIHRTGFIAKEGRTIPLNRVSGVDFEIGVVDRLFGCGTLVVTDASEHGRVELRDVPRVEQVQMKVAEELHLQSERGRPGDDGS